MRLNVLESSEGDLEKKAEANVECLKETEAEIERIRKKHEEELDQYDSEFGPIGYKFRYPRIKVTDREAGKISELQ